MTRTTSTPIDAPADSPAAAWRPDQPVLLALLGLMAVAAIWARQDAWGDIARIVRRDPEASHILLVPLVFVWLMWTYRHRFAGYVIRMPWVGVVIAAVGWAVSAYGDIRAMAIVWHLGAVIVLVGAAVSVMGVELPRRFWPAFVLLLFLLPVPGSIRQPIALFLQNASAQGVQQILMMCGAPITRAGNVLIINGTEVGIAEACNGMRMMMMLFLVCYTFVFVNPLRAWVRVTLLVLAPALALVTNVLRLVPTVLVYGYASPQTASMFHDGLGWAMVVISYVLLMGAVALLRWLMIPVDSEDERKEQGDVAAA